MHFKGIPQDSTRIASFLQPLPYGGGCQTRLTNATRRNPLGATSESLREARTPKNQFDPACARRAIPCRRPYDDRPYNDDLLQPMTVRVDDKTMNTLGNQTSHQCVPNGATFILKYMKLSEERGAYHVLALRFRENDGEFRSGATNEELQEYEALRIRAQSALDHERMAGRGSLLKLDHPLNRMLIQTGVMKLQTLLRPSLQPV